MSMPQMRRNPIGHPEALRWMRSAGFGRREIELIDKLDRLDYDDEDKGLLRELWDFATARKTAMLIGKRGVGKTLGAAYVAYWYFRKGYRDTHGSVVYRRLADLYAENSAWMSAPIGERKQAPVEKAICAGYLIIDDAHDIRASPYETMEFSRIIDDRHRGGRLDVRPTLIITNETPAEMSARFGPSVVDRCRDCVVEFGGESRRGN